MSLKRRSQKKAADKHRIDPRIERTREAIGEALVALIEEKGFESISVQTITERARINRATFYLHYRSKEDLLLRTSEAVFDSLAAEAGPIDVENLDFQEPPMQLVVLFRYMAAHNNFFRAVLSKSVTGSFSNRMREYLSGYIRSRIASLHALYPDAVPIIDDAFISEYIAGAVLGIIIWWLNAKKPHSPQFMADRFGWLSAAGAYKMLGIDPPSLDVE